MAFPDKTHVSLKALDIRDFAIPGFLNEYRNSVIIVEITHE
jgi:hypothetical protein